MDLQAAPVLWLTSRIARALAVACVGFGWVSLGADAPLIQRIDPPEKDFFSKQLDYEGIPIKAHAAVADQALVVARERLSMMLSNQPSVTSKLRSSGAELHIIGRDQVTSDLPDHRHLKGKPFAGKLTVDERTRGLGGLHTSCGEENLLRVEKDRYRGRDICVHEFAHNIFEHGMIPEWRQKVRDRYKRALQEQLWVGSYAAVNASEFFAELSMWYFGTRGDLHMTGKKPADGRQGLREYDPITFSLLDGFFTGR